MKRAGNHENCIQQIARLFTQKLYTPTGFQTDENGFIRMDDYELTPEILCNGADKYLNDKEKAEFYPAMFRLMDENFQRMEEDLVWLSDKFDYRNKDADWKNYKDALQRGMQKLRSGYPADPVHKAK